MHPAFSVIFLTTLIGVGQGLFLAVYTGQSYSAVGLLPPQATDFYSYGSFIALLFLLGGLFAAVFHLGKPSYMWTRAWRGMTQWRTSWLSRELIAIPATIAMVFIYAVFQFFGWDLNLFNSEIKGQLTLIIGSLTTLVVFGLYLCTAMIYASIRFLREWATPLTVINYTLLGGASGFTLAAVFAHEYGPELVNFYGGWAIIITLGGMISRSASLWRNSRIKEKITIKSAIGVRHSHIKQKAMGMMGGSYNTREYFHGKSALFLKSIKWIFLVLVFPIPVILLSIGIEMHNEYLLIAAFIIQYIGLLFERWFFFAQANHPQNIYYQTV